MCVSISRGLCSHPSPLCVSVLPSSYKGICHWIQDEFISRSITLFPLQSCYFQIRSQMDVNSGGRSSTHPNVCAQASDLQISRLRLSPLVLGFSGNSVFFWQPLDLYRFSQLPRPQRVLFLMTGRQMCSQGRLVPRKPLLTSEMR